MTYDQAIQYFGSMSALARAMGVSVPSVCDWRDGIPEVRQYQIELATGGKLVADKPALRNAADAPSA